MSKHKHATAHDGHGHDKGHGAGHGAAGGAGHDPAAAAAHGPTDSTFITIFLILAFLTGVEVMVPSVYDSEWNRHTKMLLLVLLACGKALLVALYFMHLKWETPWLRRIALVPAYMGVAAILLMIETAWRNSLS